MPTESFANFDFSGFNGVLNGSDFKPLNKKDISDRVIDKKDISGGRDIVGGAYSFVRGIFEKQAKEIKKALNPEKYGNEEMREKLNQVKETLEEKKKDLVAIKAEYNRLMKKVTLSKTEQKDLNTLGRKINYLQGEILALRTAQKDIAKQMNSFSYEYYEVNFIDKRLKSYLEKNPDAFKQDEQQDNRRGEQSR